MGVLRDHSLISGRQFIDQTSDATDFRAALNAIHIGAINTFTDPHYHPLKKKSSSGLVNLEWPSGILDQLNSYLRRLQHTKHLFICPACNEPPHASNHHFACLMKPTHLTTFSKRFDPGFNKLGFKKYFYCTAFLFVLLCLLHHITSHQNGITSHRYSMLTYKMTWLEIASHHIFWYFLITSPHHSINLTHIIFFISFTTLLLSMQRFITLSWI